MRWRDSRSFLYCAAWTDALRLRPVPGVHGAPKGIKPAVLLIQRAAAVAAPVDLGMVNACRLSGPGLSRGSKG